MALLLFMSLSLLAQVPSSFNYQAVLRDNAGQVKVDENVKLGILIKDMDGNTVFTEEHNTKTNKYGLITLAIGSINKTLSQVDWSKGEYFATISIDDVAMGESQLLTVPFSMYSNQAKVADIALSVASGAIPSATSYHSNVFVENSFEKSEISMNTITREDNRKGIITATRSGVYPHASSSYQKIASPLSDLSLLDFYKVSFNFQGYVDLLIATQQYSTGLDLKDATIGFWIDKSYFSDKVFFHFVNNGTKIIEKQYFKDLKSGYSQENEKGKLKVKDQIGDYVYLQITSKIGFEGLYFVVSSHNDDLGQKDVLLGGVSYVLGDVELNPRVKYKTRGEAHFPNLQGKKVCFIGDSTTSGFSLMRAFMYFTGVREIVNASLSGASIGNPTQATGVYSGNWIYNFKEFIVSNNPDIVLYNISSNDTAWDTGSADDVDDDSVSQSYYKHYHKFMEYILTNNSTVLGSGVSNLGGAEKCHLMMGWYTNIGNSVGNGQIPRRQVALNMKKAAEEISDYFCCNYLDIQKAVGARVENNLENDGLHPPAFIQNRAAYKQAKVLNDYFISNK